MGVDSKHQETASEIGVGTAAQARTSTPNRENADADMAPLLVAISGGDLPLYGFERHRTAEYSIGTRRNTLAANASRNGAVLVILAAGVSAISRHS